MCYLYAKKGNGLFLKEVEYLKPESFQLSVEREGGKENSLQEALGKQSEILAVLQVWNFTDSPFWVPKTAAGHNPPCCEPGWEVYAGAELTAPAFNTSSLLIHKKVLK